MRQICKEYDDVLAALAETSGAATDSRRRMLSELRADLEEELIQLLQ